MKLVYGLVIGMMLLSWVVMRNIEALERGDKALVEGNQAVADAAPYGLIGRHQ